MTVILQLQWRMYSSCQKKCWELELQLLKVPNDGLLMFHSVKILCNDKNAFLLLPCLLQVAETMRERYYPSFLVSDLYDRLIRRDELHSQSQCSTEEKEEGVRLTKYCKRCSSVKVLKSIICKGGYLGYCIFFLCVKFYSAKF